MQNIKNIETRTLLVTGFANEKHQTAFKSYCTNTYDVMETYTINNSFKLLFLTFYDLREAIKLYNERYDNLNYVYTISKYEIPRENERCDDTKHQSTLLFIFRKFTVPINDSELLHQISGIADVIKVRMSKNYQKCIEFYNSKQAKLIRSKFSDGRYGQGELQLKWQFDLEPEARFELIKKTDAILKNLLDMPPQRKGSEIIEDARKTRLEKNKKHEYVKLFDKFIASHLDEIESIAQDAN